MRYSHPLVLIWAAALAACGGDTGRTQDIQARISDSAGVRIVEYLGVPEVEAPFALAAEPLYRHGANPGDYEFVSVDAGRLFPDGGAVVAEWYGEVVVLSPDGTTHEVLARVGEGPGEVVEPYSAFVLGQDSVLVPDRRLSRLTLFVGDSAPPSPTPTETCGCPPTGRPTRKKARRTPSFPRTGSGWDRSRPRPGSESSMWPKGLSSECSGTKWMWRTSWCTS